MDLRSAERSITADALAESLRGSKRPVLVDVREPEEFRAGHLASSWHIPMMEFPERWAEVKARADGRTVVLYCRTGGRTAVLLEHFLFADPYPVVHLAGGLREWAIRIDPSLDPT